MNIRLEKIQEKFFVKDEQGKILLITDNEVIANKFISMFPA